MVAATRRGLRPFGADWPSAKCSAPPYASTVAQAGTCRVVAVKTRRPISQAENRRADFRSASVEVTYGPIGRFACKVERTPTKPQALDLRACASGGDHLQSVACHVPPLNPHLAAGERHSAGTCTR